VLSPRLTGTSRRKAVRVDRAVGVPRTRRSDELGAVLVLALVFMSVVSLIMLSLLEWSGNDLKNVAAFAQGTKLNYSTNSAMETAIQEVRYSTNACPNTGLTFPVDGVTVDVWCGPNPASQTPLRQIKFTACPETGVTVCTPSNPYLTVVATFDDFTTSFPIESSTPCSATCGNSMRINSWVFAHP
jgi:hypothetical protein